MSVFPRQHWCFNEKLLHIIPQLFLQYLKNAHMYVQWSNGHFSLNLNTPHTRYKNNDQLQDQSTIYTLWIYNWCTATNKGLRCLNRYIHEAEDLLCPLQKTNLTIYFSLISSQSKKYIYLVFCYPRCHTFPAFIIKCLLKFYFGPQYYTSCIMAYSHEKHSKEVQVDLFRKFKICYAQRNKPHIYISLNYFFK